jgi:hypothetical protein
LYYSAAAFVQETPATDVNRFYYGLGAEQRKWAPVVRSIEFYRSFLHGNYARLWRLYQVLEPLEQLLMNARPFAF